MVPKNLVRLDITTAWYKYILIDSKSLLSNKQLGMYKIYILPSYEYKDKFFLKNSKSKELVK